MGLAYAEGMVEHRGKEARARFLVNSRATYTVLKRCLGIPRLRASGRWRFVRADGTVIRRRISEAVIELPGYGEKYSSVVLGEDEDKNILGVVVLEIFGLMLDPFKRELGPIRALMKHEVPHR